MNNQRLNRLIKRYGSESSTKSWDGYTVKRNIVRYRLRRQTQTMLKLIKQASASNPSPNILDVGCGTGRYLTPLLSMGNIFGIDISPVMLKSAEKNTQGKAALTRGDAENLPFESNMFDVVLCSNLLENLNGPDDSPTKVIQEMFRVAKQGGTIIVDVETWYSAPAVCNYALSFFRGRRPLKWYGLREINRLAETIRPAGYRIYGISPATIFLPGIPQFAFTFLDLLDNFLEKQLTRIGFELIFEFKK